MNNFENILVSVICTAYNHEPYIRQCLEGFIMQKTTFVFEVLIHDDASTDKTADIIREYEAKYPDIIKPIYQTENQFSKRTGIMKTFQYPRVKGKYIALCEGDDYWIDSLKLQKQVDFLENNLDYSMCFHEAKILNETNIPFSFPSLGNRDYNGNELFKNWIVPTASIVARSKVISSIIDDTRILNGDINIVLSSAKQGKVYGIHEVMSIYRVQNNGLTRSRVKNDNLTLQYRYLDHYECLRENYHSIVDSKYFAEKIADVYVILLTIYIKRLNIPKCCKCLFFIMKFKPYQLFYRLTNKLISIFR